MLKTNVVQRSYRLTVRTPGGATAFFPVEAESEACARLKCPCPEGWEIVEVTPL